MAGELRIVRGRETMKHQRSWKIQKPMNLKKWALISSKRPSLPVLSTRKKRNPPSLKDHTSTHTLAMIFLSPNVPPANKVTKARIKKLMLPPKSVNLSVCSVNEMRNNEA